MKPTHRNLSKRRTAKPHASPRTEAPSCTPAEELYWFAMALTSNAEFAAKLAVEAGKPASAGRGIVRG